MATLVLACAPAPPPPEALQPDAAPALFVERPLDFEHDDGAGGARTLVEILGPGGAVLDVDGDGDLDLLLRQGAPLDARDAGPGDQLYLNHTVRSGPGPRPLVMVAAGPVPGLSDRGSYGIGATTGDVDGDGLVDVYLSNWGPDRLLRNRGDGSFEDITERSGLPAIDEITGAAAFLDIDRDGDLDLATGGYTDFSLARHRSCFTRTGALEYCGPLTYGPAPVRIFLNDGKGHFVDASEALGLGTARANALGMASFDVDGNGFPDLFVASDGLENQLWMNDGKRLRNEAGERGVAVNHAGQLTGDMGVEFADVDGDGHIDLLSTHLTTEAASLWLGIAGGFFEDRAPSLGVTKLTSPGTGFGVVVLDANFDGRLDIAIANGSVRVLDDLEARGDRIPLAQSGFLLLQDRGRFEESKTRAGEAFERPRVGRALIAADFDDDGALDLVVTANGGAAVLLQGTPPEPRVWLGLELVTPTGAPALGSVVRATTTAATQVIGHTHVDGSYASGRDPRVILTAPRGQSFRGVEIVWPRGAVSVVDAEASGYVRIQEPQSP